MILGHGVIVCYGSWEVGKSELKAICDTEKLDSIKLSPLRMISVFSHMINYLSS